MCLKCDYQRLLSDSNLRPTAHRLMVLEVVGSSPSPLSPQEITMSIEKAHRMNKVTLYRILDLLVERRLVERISSGDRSFRYGLAPNPNHPEHPHFYCNLCGNMECLDPGAFNFDLESLRKAFPALIQKVEVRVDGICKSCLQQDKAD